MSKPTGRGKGVTNRPVFAGLAALCLLFCTAPAYSVDISDVVSLVETSGWKADLGPLCEKFGVTNVSRTCIFQQLSVQEIEGRGDPRGFNVPSTHDGVPRSFVLIFHLGPLVGEFFVATTRGDLIRAFYRAKGRDYEELPVDEVREEYQRDLECWLNNLARIQSGLERR